MLVATDSQIRDQIARAWALSARRARRLGDRRERRGRRRGRRADSPGGTEDAPIVKLVNQILADAVAPAGQRHPRRAAARRAARALPRRRPAPRRHDRAPQRDRAVRDQPDQDRLGPRHRGAARPAGRPGPVQRRRRPIDARVSHPALAARREGRHPAADPRRRRAAAGRARLRAAPARAVPLGAVGQPQGLVLITGPTGRARRTRCTRRSRRSATPTRTSSRSRTRSRSSCPGSPRCSVNEKTGMTFSTRPALDPAAGPRHRPRRRGPRHARPPSWRCKASLTGHLVLTTLHTNAAVAALTRLVDMGVEPFLVASSLTAAVAQRLVRRPCPTCAAAATSPTPYAGRARPHARRPRRGDAPPAAPAAPSAAAPATGAGRRSTRCSTSTPPCARCCSRTPPRPRSPPRPAPRAWSRCAPPAVEKARAGETTFEEALRATHTDHVSAETCPTCTRTVARDMVVCPWCTSALDRGRCSGCSRQLDPDWRMCPWCRTPAA